MSFGLKFGKEPEMDQQCIIQAKAVPDRNERSGDKELRPLFRYVVLTNTGFKCDQPLSFEEYQTVRV